MTSSYNGWPASPRTADLGGLDNRDVPGMPGVKLAPGVRAGDVAEILFHFAGQFDEHVEELHAGQCWGYAYRLDTNDKSKLSCHASGTAIDLNAPEHPNGKRGTFSQDQVNTLRALLAGYDGVIAWGGDFTGVDDEMHFEIAGSAAQVAAVAAKIRAGAQPAPAPAPAHAAPGPNEDAAGHLTHPTGHDATGHGDGYRADVGDEGPEVRALQHGLNTEFPAYSHLVEDGEYGDATAAVVAEFAHREATDHATPPPAGDVEGLRTADGLNVGPRIARALHRDGVNL